MSYFCIKEIVPILQNSQPDDLLCLCYGEVDCRHHVHKFEPNYKTYIDNKLKFIELNNNFFEESLKENVNGFFKLKDFFFFIKLYKFFL